MTNGKWKIVFALVLFIALGFRISVAHWLPNDSPDDGRIYAQMARNLLDHHVYSHATEPPFEPSLIRLPGYPLLLAATYRVFGVFGHGDNGAVRMVQAFIDTATCALIALLAFYWQPDKSKKLASALGALTLAAVCPFTTIYAATILAEVPTNFLIVALLLTATLALQQPANGDNTNLKRALGWWCAAGLIGGVLVMMRPDAGLFLAAVGLTLVITGFWPLVLGLRKKSRVSSPRKLVTQVIASGAALSFAFILVLAPWTMRNWRVFHLFQPLSPAHAEMPGEFVPRGYLSWVRTWIDDDRFIEPFVWTLDSAPIDVDDLPATAFDNAEEKNLVTTLLDRYNHPDEYDDAGEEHMQTNPGKSPAPPAQPEPDGEEDDEESADTDEPASVEMTPEIDQAFGDLARKRIAQHPIRNYVWLPLKRAQTMWFDTHSQYWPFEGRLRPWDDLDYEHHQQIWLPLFAGLTALYTLLGVAGAYALWRVKTFSARRWLLLVVLAIGLRVMLFSALENPEPRYFVEFFPILCVLGGIFLARIRKPLS